MEANGTWFQTLALWQHLHRDDVVWGGGRGGDRQLQGNVTIMPGKRKSL